MRRTRTNGNSRQWSARAQAGIPWRVARRLAAVVAVASCVSLVIAPAAPVGATVAHASTVAAPGAPTVSLTFDDGPDPQWTPQVLATLARHHAVGTFFMVGRHAAAHPDLVRAVEAAGHGIGGHTWDHVALPGLSDGAFAAQVDATDQLLTSLTGHPVRAVRPPYGAVDATVRSRLAHRGLTTAMWDVDPRDWSRPGVDAIVANVLGHLHPGAVILMHDGGGDRSETVAALEIILDALDARGYRTSLFGADPVMAPSAPSAPTVRVHPVVHAFGSDAAGMPSPDPQIVSNAPLVSAATTPSQAGYWVVAADGAVFAFGDAPFRGSLGDVHLNAPIVAMAATPSGQGYWLIASDGGVFAFGDATFLGSLGAMHLDAPVTAAAATASGRGYWLVAGDGGVFSFGDAPFLGSMGGVPLHQPVVGAARTKDSSGYWLVAADGAIFSFGDADFLGSLGSVALNQPIVSMTVAPDGRGYWLAGADGGIFAFGDSGYHGASLSPEERAVAVLAKGEDSYVMVDETPVL